MEKNRELAMLVAYYLSRFAPDSYSNLGFPTQKKCHEEIGHVLSVKPSYVKNMRDEFDPIHENSRVGWYQRPLSPSRVRVVELYQNSSEWELRTIVTGILDNLNQKMACSVTDLIDRYNSPKEKTRTTVFVPRNPTGKAAEQFFIEYHLKTCKPVAGQLEDTRDLGCGYDFEIISKNVTYFVEVKGLAGCEGSIGFTSKEWETAQKFQDQYYLVVVFNLAKTPKVLFIPNPSKRLDAEIYMYTTVVTQWGIPFSRLKESAWRKCK